MSKGNCRNLPGNSRELNRLQKILEGANIKLASVVTDINGVSARKLLDRISADDLPDVDETSRLIHGRMLPGLPEIMASMEGIVTPLQRKLLSQILDHIDDLNKRISMVKDYMAEYEAAISAIDELPGIGRCSAEVILAEIGTDMNRSPARPIFPPGVASVLEITKAQVSASTERREMATIL